MPRRIEWAIKEAIAEGRLDQPFSSHDFARTCPGFAPGSYQTFLREHRVGNAGGMMELFIRVSPNRFILK
jgi:hypothetical protein